ncbi:uncharacterized protein LOC144377673 [Ictidomys tridecemlineatus]
MGNFGEEPSRVLRSTLHFADEGLGLQPAHSRSVSHSLAHSARKTLARDSPPPPSSAPGEGQSRGGRSEPRAYRLRHEGARWVLPEVPSTDRTAAAAQHRPRRQRQAPDHAAGGRSPVALRLPRSAFRLRARRHHPLPQRACSSFSPSFAIRSSSRTSSSSSSLSLDETLSCRCGAGWLRRLQSTGSGIGPTAGGRGTGGSLLLPRPKGRTKPAARPACQGQLARRAGSGGQPLYLVNWLLRPPSDLRLRTRGHKGEALGASNRTSR